MPVHRACPSADAGHVYMMADWAHAMTTQCLNADVQARLWLCCLKTAILAILVVRYTYNYQSNVL